MIFTKQPQATRCRTGRIMPARGLQLRQIQLPFVQGSILLGVFMFRCSRAEFRAFCGVERGFFFFFLNYYRFEIVFYRAVLPKPALWHSSFNMLRPTTSEKRHARWAYSLLKVLPMIMRRISDVPAPISYNLALHYDDQPKAQRVNNLVVQLTLS